MPTKIFVNLPVKDLDKSMTFFKSLGYTFNQQFTDETAACMVITDDIYSMLLTEAKFREFSPKEICDTSKSNEALISLSFDSREEVDEIVAKAKAGGGAVYDEPKDHGFMYEHGFQDLDGHCWGVFWMDPGFVQAA